MVERRGATFPELTEIQNPAKRNEETPEFGLLGVIEGLDFLAKLMYPKA
jgi:hypothetical protein